MSKKEIKLDDKFVVLTRSEFDDYFDRCTKDPIFHAYLVLNSENLNLIAKGVAVFAALLKKEMFKENKNEKK